MSFTEVTGLVQAEHALQKSEERLRLVLAGSTDAAWDWDRATSVVYYAPRWWHMVGYEIDELPNDAELWVRLMHADDRTVVLPQLEAWLNGDASTYEIEFRLQHKQGHYVHVLSRGFSSAAPT